MKTSIFILPITLCAITLIIFAATCCGNVITDMENSKPNEVSELDEINNLVKVIKETDKYNMSFEELSVYSYDDFMFYLPTKKPSSCEKIIRESSVSVDNIRLFNDLFPIEKLSIINDESVCAEYRLDKNGTEIHAFVVFEKSIKTSAEGVERETWRQFGETYFAYSSLTSNSLVQYIGTRQKISDIPFFIDLSHTIYFGPSNDESTDGSMFHSEETILLKDGYAIVDYLVDSPADHEITISDIKFIPYGTGENRYPNNSLLSNTYVWNG